MTNAALYFEGFIMVLAMTLHTATPLLLASLTGLYSQRSGFLDIALDGKMLLAAFASASIILLSDIALLGLIAAIIAAVIVALLQGIITTHIRNAHIFAGLGINMMAFGIVSLLIALWFQDQKETSLVNAGVYFEWVTWPFKGLNNTWLMEGLLSPITLGSGILILFALLLIPLTSWILYQTMFGLRLRAVGENPLAVSKAGLSIDRLRYQALIIGGVLCGLAGFFMASYQSLSLDTGFTKGMGFIALTVLLFAKSKPWFVLWIGLLFGFIDAVANVLKGIDLPVLGMLSSDAIQVLPYLFALCLLVASPRQDNGTL